MKKNGFLPFATPFEDIRLPSAAAPSAVTREGISYSFMVSRANTAS